MLPKISVLITCYNKAEYIADAIASALPQSNNIVVVDDASDDGATEVLKAFADTRLTLLMLPKNVGCSAAILAGISYCKYTDIVLLDGDDVLAPNAVAYFAHILTTYGADAVYARAVRCSDKDSRASVQKVNFTDEIQVLNDPLKRYFQKAFATSCCCVKKRHLLALVPENKVQDRQLALIVCRDSNKVIRSQARTHYCTGLYDNNLQLNRTATIIDHVMLAHLCADMMHGGVFWSAKWRFAKHLSKGRIKLIQNTVNPSRLRYLLYKLVHMRIFYYLRTKRRLFSTLAQLKNTIQLT